MKGKRLRPHRAYSSIYRGLYDPQFLNLVGREKEIYFRQRVWEYHNGLCGICQQPVDFAKMHVDHIIPASLGGRDCFENFQPSHSKCNCAKGNFGNNHYRPQGNRLSFYIDADVASLIVKLAEELSMSHTAVIQQAIRCLAKENRIIATRKQPPPRQEDTP